MRSLASLWLGLCGRQKVVAAKFRQRSGWGRNINQRCWNAQPRFDRGMTAERETSKYQRSKAALYCLDRGTDSWLDNQSCMRWSQAAEVTRISLRDHTHHVCY